MLRRLAARIDRLTRVVAFCENGRAIHPGGRMEAADAVVASDYPTKYVLGTEGCERVVPCKSALDDAQVLAAVL